jgi:DnaJ-class molecular chaperone
MIQVLTEGKRYIHLGPGERVCPDCRGRGRSWWKVPGGRNVELSCGTCYGSRKVRPSARGLAEMKDV